MIFLSLILIPIIIAILGFVFLQHQITLKEFLIQNVVQIIVAAASIGIIYSANTTDTEVWNGRITDKAMKRVSCSHSYDCFCYQSCSTDSKGHQSCHQVCQTCYEHSYDQDWRVYTDLGSFNISRVDRQGLNKPPRFEAVIIGEPYAETRSYTNYIKGTPQTLFKDQGLLEKYINQVPPYPDQVYDYYRINRVVVVGGYLPEQDKYLQLINDANRDLNPPMKVNMLLVVVFNKPQEYFYALRQAWMGGKKNDVVNVVNVDNDMKIIWSESMVWSDDAMLKIKFRDETILMDKLSPEIITMMAKNVSNHYKRKQMKDFEYLKGTIIPSTGQLVTALIIGVLLSLGLSYFFYREDIG